MTIGTAAGNQCLHISQQSQCFYWVGGEGRGRNGRDRQHPSREGSVGCTLALPMCKHILPWDIQREHKLFQLPALRTSASYMTGTAHAFSSGTLINKQVCHHISTAQCTN